MFRRISRRQDALPHREAPVSSSSHQVTSQFSTSICRFVLECSCGAQFDTNYIDEALEWHELHRELAPLVDQLGAMA